VRRLPERIVQANGVDLCAETFGDPADPAIVLMHGAGNSMLSWDDGLCERLAVGRRFVIRYDATITLASSTPGIPGRESRDLPGSSEELQAFFADEPPAPDWADRAAVIDYIVESERPFAAHFDEAAMRDLARRVVDRTADLEASMTNVFVIDDGGPWRSRLGEVAAPTLVVHGTEDPLFPYAHAQALAEEIPGAELLAIEQTGHEYFPPATWDRVVPAIIRHTSRSLSSS
jgi:pimeloyl-ACP methyl ester carboxylesterase